MANPAVHSVWRFREGVRDDSVDDPPRDCRRRPRLTARRDRHERAFASLSLFRQSGDATLKHPILRSVGPILKPDATRTVLRPFEPGEITSAVAKENSRAQKITDRILAVSDEELDRLYARVVFSLESRYRDVNDVFRRRFEEVRESLIDCHGAQGRRALLIGAYFTEEFSFESAALFNPSVVPHPDQSEAEQGDLRFLLSLRGIGGGHMASLAFRSGIWRANGEASI